MIARTLILAAALLLAGCERGTWALEGEVAAAQSDDDERAPRGLPQAEVALVCGTHRQVAHTDRAGAFALHGRGKGPHMDCVIEITAPGREKWTAQVGDVCADDDDDDRCEQATVLATLKKPGQPTASQ